MPSSKPKLHLRVVNANGPVEMALEELMARKGYMAEFDVEAEKVYVANGAQASQALIEDRADVAMQVGFGPVFPLIEKGFPLRVIAGSNLVTVHAIYTKDPKIRQLSDLVGKRVGTGALGALTHQLIFAALRGKGIDPGSVTFVPIGNSATLFKALLAGEVDAGFGETDVYEHQDRYGVHALTDGVLWNELPDFTNQASFTIEGAIKDKRPAIVATLAAHVRLYRFVQEPQSHDDYVASRMKALGEKDSAEAETQWGFYQKFKPYALDLQISEARIRYLQDLNVSMGLQKAVLPYEQVVDLSMAREAMALIEGKSPRT